MSDYTAIAAVSTTLQELLRQTITLSSDPQLKSVPIELLSPREIVDAGGVIAVSVWLYRVARNSDVLNCPGMRLSKDRTLRQPLPLDLHYLVTPMTTKAEDRQALLGRPLQTFNDHASLRGADLRGSLAGSDEELRVILEALTIEELGRIWDTFDEEYQISLSYMVQVVRIDSDIEAVRTPPVVIKEAVYSEIV
jgi:hypothetical protein